MRLQTAVIALIVGAATTSVAMADCRTIRFNFHVSQNDSISTTGVSNGGSACVHRFRSWSTSQLTSGAIASPPANGSLSSIGTLQFRYKPKSGFKGVDKYALRICGTESAGSGCSTISYSITVE